MIKKMVIGLNLDHMIKAVVGSIIGLLALVLPYISAENGRTIFFSATEKVLSADERSKAAFLLVLFVACSIVSALFAIICCLKTTVTMVRIWCCVEAIKTALVTILMFASKSIVDKAGLVSGGFMVKDMGIGYWIAFLVSYVTLVYAMKTAKINTGYIVLTILGVIWLFPILWIVLTAFREEGGYYVGYFIPKGFTFSNFTKLFTNQNVLPFGRWWLNTFIVAVSECLINTVIVLGTAYVLSRTRFGGRVTFMKILMIIGMFPGFMTMIAIYNILKGLGINQSLAALVIVSAAGAAMGYHVVKGFMDTIPKAVDEAAIIDGASRLQIFTKITIPLSKSIIVYTVLTAFLGAWSEFIFASMLLGDKQSSYVVAIGLNWMTDFRRIETYYTQFAAGAVIVAVPIVILFIWLQKFYVEGLSGAVKG